MADHYVHSFVGRWIEVGPALLTPTRLLAGCVVSRIGFSLSVGETRWITNLERHASRSA
jgi:hypothetical protein